MKKIYPLTTFSLTFFILHLSNEQRETLAPASSGWFQRSSFLPSSVCVQPHLHLFISSLWKYVVWLLSRSILFIFYLHNMQELYPVASCCPSVPSCLWPPLQIQSFLIFLSEHNTHSVCTSWLWQQQQLQTCPNLWFVERAPQEYSWFITF